MKYIISSVVTICNERPNYILQYNDAFLFLVHDPIDKDDDVAACLWRIKWKQ